jgi:hypothetical protein
MAINMIQRFKRFIAWYHVLRKNGMLMGMSQNDSWHNHYNKFNCMRWAWSNSATHEPDGKNL